VASVGYNPTVGGNAKRLEVYVLDFNADVYGHFVEVLFYKKLRNEVEFDSLCALRTAIEEDVQQTQHFFAEHNRRNL
jgi:riboflavin kinase/FMN adenylyltransferase